jgi:hypothetical protein
MKDFDERIVAACYPLFGSFLAFLVFAFGLGGWRFIFTGQSQSLMLGPSGLLLNMGIGALLGWLCYRHRHREVDVVGPLAHDAATGWLLGKRLIVIASCLAGLYFIWQLAKSL